MASRMAYSFNRSGLEAGVGVGFTKDTRSLLLPPVKLVFSSSFALRELSESMLLSSGESKSGFPANLFSRKLECLS